MDPSTYFSIGPGSDANKINITVRIKDFVKDSAPSEPDRNSDRYNHPGGRLQYEGEHADWQAKQKAIDLVTGVLPNPISVTLPLPPIAGSGGSNTPVPDDPGKILQDIVQAINAAENTLHDQNFIIASGIVEATLNLAVAQAKVTFNINPKPYS
jgi:hypothetical protein